MRPLRLQLSILMETWKELVWRCGCSLFWLFTILIYYNFEPWPKRILILYLTYSVPSATLKRKPGLHYMISIYSYSMKSQQSRLRTCKNTQTITVDDNAFIVNLFTHLSLFVSDNWSIYTYGNKGLTALNTVRWKRIDTNCAKNLIYYHYYYCHQMPDFRAKMHQK